MNRSKRLQLFVIKGSGHRIKKANEVMGETLELSNICKENMIR